MVSRLGLAPEEGIKAPVVVESAGNLTLFGLQTVNTVVLADNDRVCVKDQTVQAENGIYNAKVAAPWQRATDFNFAEDVKNGVLVASEHTGTIFQINVTGTWVPDTTPVTFGVVFSPGATATWGAIIGVLSAQTDLQAALDAKVDDSQVLTNVPAGAVFTDTLYTHPNHSGDVTSVADGPTTIVNQAVTLAKMANMLTGRFLGRNTAGTGVPEVLSPTVATALLNVFTSTLKGLVPLSGGGTVNFLRADGNWAAATYTHPNHSGDVTSVADGPTTIVANAVTLAKMADIQTARLLGRVTAATGDPESLTVAQATTLINVFTSLLKGSVPASGGGTVNFLRADGTWVATPAAPVTTVFTRSGAVVALVGDYSAFYLGIAAKAADSELLDGVDSANYARTDIAEIFAGDVRLNANVGFYNTAAGAKPTVTGSRGGNAALASLLTGLAGLGLITDSSTA